MVSALRSAKTFPSAFWMDSMGFDLGKATSLAQGIHLPTGESQPIYHTVTLGPAIDFPQQRARMRYPGDGIVTLRPIVIGDQLYSSILIYGRTCRWHFRCVLTTLLVQVAAYEDGICKRLSVLLSRICHTQVGSRNASCTS